MHSQANKRTTQSACYAKGVCASRDKEYVKMCRCACVTYTKGLRLDNVKLHCYSHQLTNCISVSDHVTFRCAYLKRRRVIFISCLSPPQLPRWTDSEQIISVIQPESIMGDEAVLGYSPTLSIQSIIRRWRTGMIPWINGWLTSQCSGLHSTCVRAWPLYWLTHTLICDGCLLGQTWWDYTRCQDMSNICWDVISCLIETMAGNLMQRGDRRKWHSSGTLFGLDCRDSRVLMKANVTW